VRRCADAGAVLFHVHARDTDGKPTLDRDVFAERVRRIKEVAPEVIVQLSTGGRSGKDWDDRAIPVRLLPEMASFTTGSNNLPGVIYENSPQFIEFLAKVFQETGVKPEIEVFETGMINNALFLQSKGYLNLPLHFQFVLGALGSMPASVRNLSFLADSIPSDFTWPVASIAKAEIPLATAAIVMGRHVRVGLEDSLYLPDGSPASNPKLVDKIVAIAKEVGREIANPPEACKIFSLDPKFKDRILGCL
jgi:3-keto-5-aminohexanoate cleavage enzyme